MIKASINIDLSALICCCWYTMCVCVLCCVVYVSVCRACWIRKGLIESIKIDSHGLESSRFQHKSHLENGFLKISVQSKFVGGDGEVNSDSKGNVFTAGYFRSSFKFHYYHIAAKSCVFHNLHFISYMLWVWGEIHLPWCL